MSSSSSWTDIESDPGVFTEMIESFGVKGVQVEELYSIDAQTFADLEPIHGFIFLFKWDASINEGRSHEDPATTDIFFAQQIVTNACATQAILSILLNSPSIDIGPHLTELKNAGAVVTPEVRGELIRDSEVLRQVHNSFARPEPFVMEDRKSGKAGDAFHFVSYLPINGFLYELDGLKRGPINHGPCTPQNWLEVIQPVITSRIEKYSSKEIRFNLLALVQNRKQIYSQRLLSTQLLKSRILSAMKALGEAVDVVEELPTPMEDSTIGGEALPTSLADLRKALVVADRDAADLQRLIKQEEDKFESWRIENIRRKHNYIPFLMAMLKMLAKKGELVPLIETARSAKN